MICYLCEPLIIFHKRCIQAILSLSAALHLVPNKLNNIYINNIGGGRDQQGRETRTGTGAGGAICDVPSKKANPGPAISRLEQNIDLIDYESIHTYIQQQQQQVTTQPLPIRWGRPHISVGYKDT
ncbi:hypothetical protein Dimus_010222 [Dionaea muscipula]